MRPVVLLALVTACSWLRSSTRDEEYRPSPLVLDPDAPLPVAGTCTFPVPAASAAAVPTELAPRLEQGLELIELRGDLRLSTVAEIGWRTPTAWSGDGNLLAIGEPSGVFVWEAATGALRGVIPLVPRRTVDAVALSASGEQVAFIASADGDHSLFVASLAAPRQVRRFDAPRSDLLRFSSDDTRVIAHNAVGSPATVWDLSNGTRTVAKATEYGSHVLPDGVHLIDRPLSRSNDAVELRELSTGRVLRRFHVGLSAHYTFSTDRARIAIAGKAGVDVFAFDDGRRVRRFPELALSASGDIEQTFMLSPDGSRLLFSHDAGGSLHATEMWDVTSGRRLWRTYLSNLGFWRFSDDGKYLLASIGQPVAMIRADDGGYVSLGHRLISLSPDSRWQLLERANRGRGWPNWPEIAPLDPDGGNLGIARAGWVVARSRDGKYTASIGVDGKLQLESDDGCIALGVSTSESTRATFTADGRFLLVALGRESPVYAWSTHEGAAVRAVTANGTIVELLADTGRVLFGHNQKWRGPPWRRVYDLVVGQEVHYPATTEPVLDPLSIRQTDATHDGRQLFVAGTPALELVDLENPARNAVLHPRATLVAISPDDRLVAAASQQRVDLWTRIDWKSQIYVTHDQPVARLAFSADGTLLASADEGGLVIVTRTLDGKQLARLRLPYDRVMYLWLSADGTELEVDTARGLRVRARLVLP